MLRADAPKRNRLTAPARALRPALFGILWPARVRPARVPAQEGEVRMGDAKTYKMYIGGEWADAADGQTRKIVSPANGDVIAEVPKASAEDVDRAVAAARKTYDETWSDTTPGERQPALLQDGRPGRGARRRARAPRVRERGQGPTRSRCPRRSRSSPTSSGSSPAGARVLGGPRRRRVHEGVHEHPPARADRRRRADRPVELPAVHGGVEARARRSPPGTPW